MKKLICYSLYGQKALYPQCLLSNLEALREVYDSTWTIRVYFDEDISSEYVERLSHECEVVEKPRNQGTSGMLWRYSPLFESGVERFIALDADDLVSRTFYSAVLSWIESDRAIMRFKFFRSSKILGGYFGAKGGLLRQTPDPIFSNISCEEHFQVLSSTYREWGDDEHWLSHVVYEQFKDSCYASTIGHYHIPGAVAHGVIPIPDDSVIRTKNLVSLMRYGGYPVHYELGMTRAEIDRDSLQKALSRKAAVFPSVDLEVLT